MILGFTSTMDAEWDRALFKRAESFGLTLVPKAMGSAYQLISGDNGAMTLHDPQGRRLSIDFDGSSVDYRRRGPRGKQEIIARAVGSKQGCKRVLDLSAGLAQDAVFLSQLGFEVTAVERNPLLAFLLAEAKQRTLREDLQTLRFLWADSQDLARDPMFLRGFDSIYFDPMYPSSKKTALPRQEMLLFRELVGKDEDAEKLVAMLIEVGVSRLVIKRPLEAPPLAAPTHSFEGKTVRYDVIVRAP